MDEFGLRLGVDLLQVWRETESLECLENGNEFRINYSWHQHGDDYFPCVTVIECIGKAGIRISSKILKESGAFAQAEAAKREAERVTVTDVRGDGEVVYRISPA